MPTHSDSFGFNALFNHNWSNAMDEICQIHSTDRVPEQLALIYRIVL